MRGRHGGHDRNRPLERLDLDPMDIDLDHDDVARGHGGAGTGHDQWNEPPSSAVTLSRTARRASRREISIRSRTGGPVVARGRDGAESRSPDQ